jgi:hypothetical protein
MAREYKVPVCTGCGVQPQDCSCAGGVTCKPVTAYDKRDVQPLIEAARKLLSVQCQLVGGVIFLSDGSNARHCAEHLDTALAPFEESGEGS